MEIFESDQPSPAQQQTILPVEPEPRYRPTTASLATETDEHGHAWIHTISLILLGLVLVVAFVLLARWAYHRTHHNNSATSSSKVSTNAKLSDAAGNGSSLQNSSPSAPSNPSTSSKTASPPTPADNNTKIANTGPGNVVGLFVGTSLAAAGLHFVVGLRRFNRCEDTEHST